jgi:hypothetical protein
MNKIKTLAAAGALATSASAHAILPPIDPVAGYGGAAFNFSCLVGCSETPAVGSQLFLQVLHDIDPSDGTDPNVYFKFFNMVGVTSSVEQISVDGMSGFTKLTGSGTNFVEANSPNPKNLPGGNTASPAFAEDFTYEAVSNNSLGFNGKPAAGINAAGETMEFYKSTSYNDVIAAMASGNLRFGLHVIAFENGNSATYLNNPLPVPEPETWAMLAAGLGIMGIAVARRRTA